jgi:hypothetical protein
MAFNRLQIGLSFLCLLAFGASVGTLLAGISTYIPYLFLVLMITLVAVSVPGFESAVREFIGRNRNVAQPVDHVAEAESVYAQATPEQAGSSQSQSNGWLREACTSFWTNVKAFFQSVVDGTREFADRNGPQARQILANASDSVRSTASASSNRVGESVKSSPYLWVAIILATVSISVFAYSYVDQSFGTAFHVAFVPAIFSAIFFAGHLDWDRASEWLGNNKAVIWLVASVTILASAIGHGWSISSIVYSTISTLCAIITVAKKWDVVKQGAKRMLKSIFEVVFKFLRGGYGYVPLLATIALGLLIYMVPNMDRILVGDELEQSKLMSIGYVVALLVGLAVFIYKAHKGMDKKKKKK